MDFGTEKKEFTINSKQARRNTSEQASKSEVLIPPVYHWHDGIDQPRIDPRFLLGFPIFNATPTHKDEEGKIVFSTDGNDVILWSMLNKVWNPIGFLPAYGEMYQHDVPTTIPIATQNVWYNITGMSAGINRNVVFQNGNELKIGVPGTYMVAWSVSFKDGGATTYQIGVSLNGTIDDKTDAHATTVNPNDKTSASGHGIMQLAIDDILILQIQNNDNTNDPVIDHAILTVQRIGN